MNKDYDEPIYVDVRVGIEKEAEQSLTDTIKSLCKDQPFAVIATQGKKHTDASLIAFAGSEDLKYIVFATPKNTSKYTNLDIQNNISLLIDNRSTQPDSINEISAMTVTGSAAALTDEKEIETWAGVLTMKHPYLNNFVRTPSTGLVLIKVDSYFYVRRFQEVFEWSPNQD